MSDVEVLKERIARRDYTIGVIGLGYVGLPLVLRFGEVDAAVRFCATLFGAEFASTLAKAAQVAAKGEQKVAKG